MHQDRPGAGSGSHGVFGVVKEDKGHSASNFSGSPALVPFAQRARVCQTSGGQGLRLSRAPKKVDDFKPYGFWEPTLDTRRTSVRFAKSGRKGKKE